MSDSADSIIYQSKRCRKYKGLRSRNAQRRSQLNRTRSKTRVVTETDSDHEISAPKTPRKTLNTIVSVPETPEHAVGLVVKDSSAELDNNDESEMFARCNDDVSESYERDNDDVVHTNDSMTTFSSQSDSSRTSDSISLLAHPRPEKTDHQQVILHALIMTSNNDLHSTFRDCVLVILT